MESPGEYLKRERELRRVSLQKIHEATRIPIKFLESIEQDRYEGLPHATFIKGFIRSYCKVLGVDETDAVLRFEMFLKDKEEAEAAASGAKAKSSTVKQPALKKKSPAQNPVKPSEGLPAKLRKHAIVAAGILIIVVAYAFSIKKDASIENGAKPPVQAAADVDAPVPSQPALDIATRPAAALPDSAQPQQAAPAPQTPVQPAQPAATPLQPVAPPAEKPKAQEPVKKEEASKPETLLKEEAAPLLARDQTLTARASEMVWIKIGVDGNEPIEVLLREGESFTWKAAEGFSLIVGNAGGVALTYNGKELSNLGLPGEVISLKLPSGKQQRIKRPQEKPLNELPQPETNPAPEMLNTPVTGNNVNAKVP